MERVQVVYVVGKVGDLGEGWSGAEHALYASAKGVVGEGRGVEGARK